MMGKYRQAGGNWKENLRGYVWEALLLRERGGRRASWMWWILPFLALVFFSWSFFFTMCSVAVTLTGSLNSLSYTLCHIERFTFISRLAAAKQASSRLGGLSPPLPLFCFSVSLPRAGKINIYICTYVSQVSNPPYAVPGTTLKQETKHLTPASLHLELLYPLPASHTTRHEAPSSIHLLRNCTYHDRQSIPVRLIRRHMHQQQRRTLYSLLYLNPIFFPLPSTLTKFPPQDSITGTCVNKCGYRKVTFDSNCDSGKSILFTRPPIPKFSL